MASLKTLNSIMKDKKLLQAFENFLQRQKLDRAWEFARLHKDPRTAYRIFVANMTSKEKEFAPSVKENGDELVKKLSPIIADRWEESNPKFTSLPFADQQKLVEEKLYAEDHWTKFLPAAKNAMLERFEKLANGAFRSSDEYKKVIRGSIDGKKAASELGLEAELDAFLGLAVAIGTGDKSTESRLSKVLESKQKPKKGKPMKQKELREFILKCQKGWLPDF